MTNERILVWSAARDAEGIATEGEPSLYIANEIARRNLYSILWNAGATDAESHVEAVNSKGVG